MQARPERRKALRPRRLRSQPLYRYRPILDGVIDIINAAMVVVMAAMIVVMIGSRLPPMIMIIMPSTFMTMTPSAG